MKKLLFFLLIIFSVSISYSQDLSKFHLYSPEENAEKAIAESVKKAKAEGKHVLIQIGGNWCIWCARFNDFVNNKCALRIFTVALLDSNLCKVKNYISKKKMQEQMVKIKDTLQPEGLSVSTSL